MRKLILVEPEVVAYPSKINKHHGSTVIVCVSAAYSVYTEIQAVCANSWNHYLLSNLYVIGHAISAPSVVVFVLAAVLECLTITDMTAEEIAHPCDTNDSDNIKPSVHFSILLTCLSVISG